MFHHCRQRIRVNPTAAQGQIILRQRVRVTTPAPQPTFASAQNDDDDEHPFVRQQPRPFPPFQSTRPSIFQDVSQSLEDDNRRPSPFGRGLFNFDEEVHRLASIPTRPSHQPQPLYEQPFRQVVHQPSQPGRQVCLFDK